MTDQMTPEEEAVKEFQDTWAITMEQCRDLLEIIQAQRADAAENMFHQCEKAEKERDYWKGQYEEAQERFENGKFVAIQAMEERNAALAEVQAQIDVNNLLADKLDTAIAQCAMLREALGGMIPEDGDGPGFTEIGNAKVALTATQADAEAFMEKIKREAFHNGFQAAMKAGVEGPFNLMHPAEQAEGGLKPSGIPTICNSDSQAEGTETDA